MVGSLVFIFVNSVYLLKYCPFLLGLLLLVLLVEFKLNLHNDQNIPPKKKKMIFCLEIKQLDIYFSHIYLSSAPLQAVQNLELILVREEKYAHQETQYNMDHITYHTICPFAMRTQRKEITFSWVGKGRRPLSRRA